MGALSPRPGREPGALRGTCVPSAMLGHCQQPGFSGKGDGSGFKSSWFWTRVSHLTGNDTSGKSLTGVWVPHVCRGLLNPAPHLPGLLCGLNARSERPKGFANCEELCTVTVWGGGGTALTTGVTMIVSWAVGEALCVSQVISCNPHVPSEQALPSPSA